MNCSLGDEQGNRGPPNGAGAGPAAAAAAEQDPFDFDDAEAEGADVPANPPPPLDAASGATPSLITRPHFFTRVPGLLPE